MRQIDKYSGQKEEKTETKAYQSESVASPAILSRYANIFVLVTVKTINFYIC